MLFSRSISIISSINTIKYVKQQSPTFLTQNRFNFFQRTSIENNNRRFVTFRKPTKADTIWSAKYRFGLAIGTGILFAVASGIYLYFQDEVPYVKRKRWMVVPSEWEKHLSLSVGEELLPEDDPLSKLVDKIGKRLVRASGYENMFDWEFKVIKNQQVNAFTSFGGKVYVCTGILPILRDRNGNYEDGLAAVLGHEIGHGIARHLAERATRSLITGFIFSHISLPTFLGEQLTTYGFELPFSRSQEMEADYIGLQIFVQACYHPDAYIEVEERMEEALRGKEPFKYLNSHPPEAERIEKAKEWKPAAMEVYYSLECHEKRGILKKQLSKLIKAIQGLESKKKE